MLRRTREVRREATLRPQGITDRCAPTLQTLGRSGSHIVYVVRTLDTVVDPTSKLTLFPVDEALTGANSAALCFGTPNTFMMLRRGADDERGSGWNKFAAFMFFRDESRVVDTKGRVQAGIMFELLDLPEEAQVALRREAARLSGKRSPTCAFLNARVLAAAGFTCGGHSLKRYLRPSKLASRIWRRGLEYRGRKVELRIIQAGERGIGDHFVGVWFREVYSYCRNAKKKFVGFSGRGDGSHAPAPVFEPQPVRELSPERWTGRPTTVGVNRPTRLAANLAFLWGQHPLWTVKLPCFDHPALDTRLMPYEGRVLDRATRMKKRVFNKHTLAIIKRQRIGQTEWYENLPAGAVLDMLTPSPGPDHDTATLYNCVVVPGEARIVSLKNHDPRSQRSRWVRIIDWIMAKHVLAAGYDEETVFAGELWCYLDGGEVVLCLNNNSGTYKPGLDRLEAIAEFLRELFGVRVIIFPMG